MNSKCTSDRNSSRLHPVRVSRLLQGHYWIPSYQRGYRWKKEQVEDLLNDIHGFMGSNPQSSDWYCLQPVVVKFHKSLPNTRLENIFELVDGQQRLTTLALIAHYVNSKSQLKSGYKIPEPILHYQTRSEFNDFLQTLGKPSTAVTNVDFHYMRNAFSAIEEWCEVHPDMDWNSFVNVLLHRTRVIGYLVEESDSIAVFTRLNSGKIPLTNAELIKALFLRQSTMQNAPHHGTSWKLRIASEWDAMEAKLQQDNFWRFISPKGYEPETRIDLVFRMIVTNEGKGAHGLFREYQKTFHEKSLKEKWQDVRDCFTALEEWHDNFELYHCIGFLVTSESLNFAGLRELYQQACKLTKKGFKSHLKSLVKLPENWIDLRYGETDVRIIRKILLLHNVTSILKSRQCYLRFPFELYNSKDCKWDVEHIHSIADRLPTQDKPRKDWLTVNRRFVAGRDLEKRIDGLVEAEKMDTQEFQSVANELIESSGIDKNVNGLQNLTLLSAEINRSYKNALFSIKRQEILNRERDGEFIPLCTKNVFLKLYSQRLDNLTQWQAQDQEDYLFDMDKTIHWFFDSFGVVND